MKKKSGFTLIEMLVVISIIAILAAILMPAISAVRRAVKKASTKTLIGTISMGLENYASDFSSYYPPADCEDVSAQFAGQMEMKNSAHTLCVFLTTENLTDDGRQSGNYLNYKAKNLLNKGKDPKVDVTFPIIGTVKAIDDYVIDAFKNPVVYDERKSEDDDDGLNTESFVLVSGGAFNKDNSVTMANIDTGDLSMFSTEQQNYFDTDPATDYKDTIPENQSDNDDLFND